MDSNFKERGARPKSNKNQHNKRQDTNVVRKVPPRVGTNRCNIYITSKTNFKVQQQRCENLINSGAKEIFLHCMGFSITRGLNLALHLVNHSEGTLGYAINTSTIELLDEVHPLCDDDDITFRERYNSALHIKIFNRSLFDIIVPKLPAQPPLPVPDDSADHRASKNIKYQKQRMPHPQQKPVKTKQ